MASCASKVTFARSGNRRAPDKSAASVRTDARVSGFRSDSCSETAPQRKKTTPLADRIQLKLSGRLPKRCALQRAARQIPKRCGKVGRLGCRWAVYMLNHQLKQRPAKIRTAMLRRRDVNHAGWHPRSICAILLLQSVHPYETANLQPIRKNLVSHSQAILSIGTRPTRNTQLAKHTPKANLAAMPLFYPNRRVSNMNGRTPTMRISGASRCAGLIR